MVKHIFPFGNDCFANCGIARLLNKFQFIERLIVIYQTIYCDL